MADEDYRRKPIAVPCTDVEGYSKLMGYDELATVSTLKSQRYLTTEYLILSIALITKILEDIHGKPKSA
jgi:hypothetical protein